MRNPTVIGAGAYGGRGGNVVTDPRPVYEVVCASPDVVEGTPVSFTVVRGGNPTPAGGVNWAVTSGTPADFGGSLPSGHAVFGPGVTSFPVTLPTSGNAVVQSFRPYQVGLSNPDPGGILGPGATFVGSILDDDTSDPWALFPAWDVVAFGHVASGAPPTTAAAQTARGVTITTQAYGTVGDIFEVWWKKRFPATHDFTVVFEYVRTAQPGTNRIVAFHWDTVGDETAGHPASVPNWTGSIQAQITHASGAYIEFDQASNAVQAFTFDKAAPVQVGADVPLTLALNTRYSIKIKRVGTTVTLTATNLAAGTSVTTSWTAAGFERGVADGYFGLVDKGSVCTLENVTVSDDGNVIVPAGFATAPRSARIPAWETARMSTGASALVETGTVEADGVELKGGPKETPTTPLGTHAIALISLTQITLPGTLRFGYFPISTWTAEAPLTADGVFSQVGLYQRINANTDLSSLGALSGGEWLADYPPVDAYYSNGNVSPARATGGRFSFDTHSFNGNSDNQVRLRFIHPDGTEPGPIGGVQTFDFRTPGGWTDVSISFDTPNNRVVVKATKSDGSVASETMTDPTIGTYLGIGPLNVVLMAFSGRDAKVRNVSWSPGEVDPGGIDPGGGGSDGLATAFPDTTSTVIQTTAAGLPAAYAALTPTQISGGATLLVAPGGTLSSALTLGKSGTATKPIIIRVGTLVGGAIVDPATFPDGANPSAGATIASSVTLSGRYNWLRGFRVTKGGLHSIGGVGNRASRCFFTGQSILGGSAYFTDNGDGLILDWCELGLIYSVFLQHLPHNGAKNFFVYRCYFHDQTVNPGSAGTFHMIGTSDKDSKVPTNSLTFECLYGAGGTAGEAWEAKSASGTVERCASTDTKFLTRHGMNNKMLALYCTNGAYIGFRGSGHLMADCVSVGLTPRSWGPFSGNLTYDDWFAQAGPSGTYPNGVNVRIVRCHNPIIGDTPSGIGTHNWPVFPAGTELWNCTGTQTYKFGAPPVPSGSIHAGNPPDVPPRAGGKGAILWPTSKVGPNGTWSATD